MSDDIIDLGYKADYSARIPYRHCAFRAGFNMRGVNGLLFHPVYGNYITIQCILTNMPLDIANENTKVDICNECNLCITACKSGALNPSGIVTRNRCKRDYMPGRKYITEEMRALIGRELIGCRICRAVCPINNKIDFVAPPDDLLNACFLPKLMDFDSNQDEFNTLANLIGKNEIRKLRLAKSLVIIAGNTNDKKYIPLIENINKKYTDDELNEYSVWAIK